MMNANRYIEFIEYLHWIFRRYVYMRTFTFTTVNGSFLCCQKNISIQFPHCLLLFAVAGRTLHLFLFSLLQSLPAGKDLLFTVITSLSHSVENLTRLMVFSPHPAVNSLSFPAASRHLQDVQLTKRLWRWNLLLELSEGSGQQGFFWF